ncbi:MAG: rhomboid family intramembrane serine protease, partial [Erysipelotrichaceae bacterium]|nr:rhomboid family intramembrane serine protease [Erysipelotrichaceae bacterium]
DVTNSFPKNGDVWLANPNATFPAIHISYESQAMNLAVKDKIQQQFDSLMKVVGTQGSLLDISLDTAGSVIEDNGMLHLAMYPGAQIPDKVSSSLENLHTVLFNVDDPETEAKKLTKDIQDYALEHNTPKKRRRRQVSESFSKTFLIAGSICITIWAAILIIAAIGQYNTTSVAVLLGAYYKAFILIFNDWWRLLSGGFVHINLWHIWCNMMSLYTLSKPIENKLGVWKTMTILLVSVITGNLAVFIGEDNVVTVGLSGGLYGLIGTLAIIYWKEGYFKIPALRRNFLSLMYINIIINFMPNISVLGHIGGLVGGLFMGMIFVETENRTLRTNFIVVGVLLVIALAFFAGRVMYVNEVYYGTDLEVSKIVTDIGFENIGKTISKKALEYYTSH